MKFSLVLMLAAAMSAQALEDRTFWPIVDPGHHDGHHQGGHGGGRDCPVMTSTITKPYTETVKAPTKTVYQGKETITNCVAKVGGTLTKTIWGWETEVTKTKTKTIHDTTITHFAPATTSTCTEEKYHKTCSKKHDYRRFQTYTPDAPLPAITSEAAEPQRRITNAERLKRGLPLAQPQPKKRTFWLDGSWHDGEWSGHGDKPKPPAQVSCLPTTTTITQTKCVATSTVTPTITKPIATTSACATTKTKYTDVAYTTEYKRTLTKVLYTTTALNTVTDTVKPTVTTTTTVVKPIYTGKCSA